MAVKKDWLKFAEAAAALKKNEAPAADEWHLYFDADDYNVLRIAPRGAWVLRSTVRGTLSFKGKKAYFVHPEQAIKFVQDFLDAGLQFDQYISPIKLTRKLLDRFNMPDLKEVNRVH